MTEAERIWREKGDEELLEAAAELDQFTAEGQLIICAELKRRGLEDPVEQGGGDEPEEEAPPVECLRCSTELHLLDTEAGDAPTAFSRVRGLRSLVELSDSFDVYVCPHCGHVDLFARLPVEDAASD